MPAWLVFGLRSISPQALPFNEPFWGLMGLHRGVGYVPSFTTAFLCSFWLEGDSWGRGGRRYFLKAILSPGHEAYL